MGVAQEGEVVEVRRSAIGPVHQVMSLEPSLPLAAWESATEVAVAEHPQELAGYSAAASTDADGTVSPLKDPLDPSVAGKPTDALRSDTSAGLDLR
jgi:hypothetical protein